MVGRGESTEAAWALIASLLSASHRRGRRVRSSSTTGRATGRGDRPLAHLQTTSDAVGERVS
jgi:hypothetical protein